MSLFIVIMDVFEDCSILAEKQWLKPKRLSSLKNFAALDTLLNHQESTELL